MGVIQNNLGATIKQARISVNLTQEELAEHIGVTGRYIMALENEHKQPSFEVLCKLILVLNIPADNNPSGQYFLPEKLTYRERKRTADAATFPMR